MSARHVLPAAGFTALLFVFACDSGDEPIEDCELDTEPYIAGMSVSGERFSVALTESLPAPPAKGDNTWTLGVTDSADAPVSGLDVSLTPYMPQHQHGTPIEAAVTPGDASGTYVAEPVNLWMPGVWEVTVELDDGSAADSVVFSFCIDG